MTDQHILALIIFIGGPIACSIGLALFLYLFMKIGHWSAQWSDQRKLENQKRRRNSNSHFTDSFKVNRGG